MKLVQLNIWQGKLLKEVIGFLQEQNADIVCLQEVFSSQHDIAVLDIIDSLEKIQEALGYDHIYFEPTFSLEIASKKVFFGNAILSKLELKNKRTVFTHNSFHHVTNWDEHPPNTRNALLAETNVGGKDVTIVSHHGYHDLDPLGNDNTVKAMQKLVNELKKSSGPLILAGDLNIKPASKAMRLFDNWLTDLTETYEIQDTLSQFGKVANVPCDHILVSKDIQVNDFNVSEALVSDHRPLILEFEA